MRSASARLGRIVVEGAALDHRRLHHRHRGHHRPVADRRNARPQAPRCGYTFLDKVAGHRGAHCGEINGYAIVLGLGTFLITKYLLKVSVFIPAPLIALGVDVGSSRRRMGRTRA